MKALRQIMLVVICTQVYNAFTQSIGPGGFVSFGSWNQGANYGLGSTIGQTSGASFSNGSVQLTSGIEQPALSVSVMVRAFLDGPFVSDSLLMFDGLRQQGLIPISEPFTALGYVHHGNGGHEFADTSIFQVSGPNAIVDWILVELRNASNPQHVLSTRSGLLQRDGDIVATDGMSPLEFEIASAPYLICIRHRNHLGVLSGTTISPAANGIFSFDFSSPDSTTFGTEAMKLEGSRMTLWAGDVNQDGLIKYIGSDNDRDELLVTIGGSVPTNTTDGYLQSDLNLDGTSKYIGGHNDRDLILVNIGGSVPTNIRIEQLP